MKIMNITIMALIWLILILFTAISSGMHEELLSKYGDRYGRIGFWERMWFGASCIACYEFFDLVLP